MRQVAVSLVIAALVGTLALGGCAIPGSQVSSGTLSSCENISGGACQEQLDVTVARHAGARSVVMKCTAPVCDRKGGSGTVTVILASGAILTEAFAYAGDRGPMPIPTCKGVAPDVCRSIAEPQFAEVAPSKRVVGIAIACTAAPCTTNKGDTNVTLTFGDGSQQQGGVGWEGGPP